ncbi:hypothetical protein MUA04_00995 [Enterobacteriaceae bacterium H11S18]|uniref:hypothetical protein n=1 Tax=Dryocola clanedunensis TaxID=2925396 RepID=UPI0022F02EA4|nr:hypothetical protein [Dryocola clanedunensis]MCT4708812.1 hypothetical protein [Dryocola clanedunensis]
MRPSITDEGMPIPEADMDERSEHTMTGSESYEMVLGLLDVRRKKEKLEAIKRLLGQE